MSQNDQNYLPYFHAVSQFYPTPQHDSNCPLCSPKNKEQRDEAFFQILSAIASHAFSDITHAYRQIFYNIYDYQDSCPYDIEAAYYIVDTTPKRFAQDYETGHPKATKALLDHAKIAVPALARRIVNQHRQMTTTSQAGPFTPKEIKKLGRITKRVCKDIMGKIKKRIPLKPLPAHCTASSHKVEFLGALQQRPDRPLSILLTDMETVILSQGQQQASPQATKQDRAHAAECLQAILSHALNNARFPGKNTPLTVRERIKISPIANEMHLSMRDRFEETYGRPMTDSDPLFPDFDSPTPTPMPPHKMKETLADTARQQGICPLLLLSALQVEPTEDELKTLLQQYFSIPETTIQNPGYKSYGFITPTLAGTLQDSHQMTARLSTGMLWIQIDPTKVPPQTLATIEAQPNFVGQYHTDARTSNCIYVFRQVPSRQITRHDKARHSNMTT